MKIIFATQNKYKVEEINLILKGTDFEIVTMGAIGYNEDIPETGSTLEENALIKAKYLHGKIDGIILSEDTGLEIEALDGEPGVHTARYAGPEKDADLNMNKVLDKLQNSPNRNAQFRAVLAMIDGNTEMLFEGVVKGDIVEEKKGEGGFGYDPIFRPEGYDQTFAEMEESVKKEISHRARAIRKLIEFLSSKMHNKKG